MNIQCGTLRDVNNLSLLLRKIFGFQSTCSSSASLCDAAGNVIRMNALSGVSMIRRWAKRPPLARIVGIEFQSPCRTVRSTSRSARAQLLERLSWGLQRNPDSVPLLSAVATAPPPLENPLRAFSLSQVVLGMQDGFSSAERFLGAYMERASPGLFHSREDMQDDGTMVRLIPSRFSTLTLSSPLGMESVEKVLRDGGIFGGKVGFRGDGEHGQLFVNSPLTGGLDLRVAEANPVQPFWFEGESAVKENVLRGIGDVAHKDQLNCGEVMRKELFGVLREKLNK